MIWYHYKTCVLKSSGKVLREPVRWPAIEGSHEIKWTIRL